MIYFVVHLVFYFFQWKIYGNVPYLVTIETLKVGVVFPLILSSCPLELLGRFRLIASLLLEVRLNSSSLGREARD